MNSEPRKRRRRPNAHFLLVLVIVILTAAPVMATEDVDPPTRTLQEWQAMARLAKSEDRFADAELAWTAVLASPSFPELPADQRIDYRLEAASAKWTLGLVDTADSILLVVEREITDATPRDLRIRARMTRSALAIMHGQWRVAEVALHDALALAPDPELLSAIDNNLGYIARERGDLAAANAAFERAIRRGNNDGGQRAVLWHNLAQVFWLQGDPVRAEAAFAASAKDSAARNPTSIILANTLIAQGLVMASMQRRIEADALIGRGQAIFAAQDTECRCHAGALLDIGHYQLNAGRPDAAGRTFTEALALLHADEQGGAVHAALLRARGAAYAERGEPALALVDLRASLKFEQQIDAAGAGLVFSLYMLGRTEAAAGDRRQSREHLCQATDILDHMRLPLPQDALSQSRFRAHYDDLYRACIRAEWAAGRHQQAFLGFQRAHTRGFRNALFERDLLVVDAKQKERLLAWRSASAPALAELQASLPADVLWLGYSFDAEGGLIFALNRRGLKVVRSDWSAERLEQRIRTFNQLIERGENRDLPAIKAIAAELYGQLIAPAMARSGSPARLWLSVDADLAALPFAALYDRDRGRYLVQDRSLRLVDGLASVGALQPESKAAPRLLAAGDPLIGADSLRKLNRTLNLDLAALPALPSARIEVRRVAKAVGGDSTVLVGAEAGESRVRALIGSADWVHLAVHAWPDRKQALNSVLVLGRSDPTEGDDGLLHAYEIMQSLRLRAGSTVVLSACETALGQSFAGDGVLGLSRAFRFAGATAVVASLWRIEDESTAEFMDAFYRARKPGLDVAESLRLAALSQLQRTDQPARSDTRAVGGLSARLSAPEAAHPFRWAGFQLHTE